MSFDWVGMARIRPLVAIERLWGRFGGSCRRKRRSIAA
jgi:hypothetical protein